MQGVGADIRLPSDIFSSRRWSDDDDEDEDRPHRPPSAREMLAREAAELVAQQKRLSVRDLASKFEKGQNAAQAAASKLAESARLQEALKLDKRVLVTRLQNVLSTLGGRVAGRNKDDVDEAAALVEALSVQLVQTEAEETLEKHELHKMAAIFKQASIDAKNMVEEARRVAQYEIEIARAAVARAEDALAEREIALHEAGKQELDALRREVQEAKRIKMLHEQSKVMDMEYKLQGLQQQLDKKSAEVLQLRNELEVNRHGKGDKRYRLKGAECLGARIQVIPAVSEAYEIEAHDTCSFQWHRITEEGDKKELITGAVKSQYAPEPFDVGKFLRVEITSSDGQKEYLSTSGAVEPAPGLGNYVEALAKKGGAEFSVVVVQHNGENLPKQVLHTLEIGKMRLKLCKGRSAKVKEQYNNAMQFCGARGGGEAAPLAVFWLVKRGFTLMLAFQSERERNAAIMLARRLAFDCNVMLAGPDENRKP